MTQPYSAGFPTVRALSAGGNRNRLETFEGGPIIVDNNSVTHGLHWLTFADHGWTCTNPDCEWWQPTWFNHAEAQHAFNRDHAKPSEWLAFDGPDPDKLEDAKWESWKGTRS